MRKKVSLPPAYPAEMSGSALPELSVKSNDGKSLDKVLGENREKCFSHDPLQVDSVFVLWCGSILSFRQ